MAKLLLGREKGYSKQSLCNGGVLELAILRGRNLVPKDSNGEYSVYYSFVPLLLSHTICQASVTRTLW